MTDTPPNESSEGAPVAMDHGLPVGRPLPHWQPRELPLGPPMQGRHAIVRRLDAQADGPALYRALCAPDRQGDWTYMAVGPFADEAAYLAHLRSIEASTDPMHHTVIDRRTGELAGTAALMRSDRANGVTEVGWISWSPAIQRTPVATEAIALLLTRVFDEFGYRRVEWKCDALNARSRQAALRFGFRYEGLFRQAVVYKGRSRDTAWFSIIDGEWPAVRDAFARWLDPSNFDADGRQRRRLAELRDDAAGRPS